MYSRENGQTLLELIVVVAVSVIVVSALVFAIIASLRNASFSKNQAQATKLAQEGIERVRIGRDRNQDINNIPGSSVNSWNGNQSGTGSIWNYQISTGCGSGVAGTACYFSILSSGVLSYFASSPTFPTSGAEMLGQFKRAIIINDAQDTFNIQKTVTSIVTWTDFSGAHESRLTTILRRIQ